MLVFLTSISCIQFDFMISYEKGLDMTAFYLYDEVLRPMESKVRAVHNIVSNKSRKHFHFYMRKFLDISEALIYFHSDCVGSENRYSSQFVIFAFFY